MKKVNQYTRLLAFLVTLVSMLSFGVPVVAQDDGARAYWNTRSGTQMFSFQYLPMNIGASGSMAFAPDKYIYPNSYIDASVFLGTWGRHMTLFRRPSVIAVNVIGGSVNASVDATISPEFLPPGMDIDTVLAFSQSSSGFADPSVQLVTNLFGTPRLISNVDMLNYEPTVSLDAAVMVAFPLGQYETDKLINMGLNRWYGRVALPFKWHFGVFAPGYMSSLELTPSVWLFADNSDFMGKTLKNDPLFSLEAHLTHDFAPGLFGSLDMLYQNGFQSKMDTLEVGDKLDIGILGFTLNYNVTENVMIRSEFTSNVFGDESLETSVGRIQFVYLWNQDNVNVKKLMQGH
jgi:hypothetical protein